MKRTVVPAVKRPSHLNPGSATLQHGRARFFSIAPARVLTAAKPIIANEKKRQLLIAILLTTALTLTALPYSITHFAPFAPKQVLAANPITIENAQPGSTGWQFDFDSSGNPLEASNHQIEGYASATSVNQGGQVSFMVSLSSSAQYTMDVYRMGYYPTGTNPDGSACAGPCGGRLMQHIGPLNGAKQATCPTTTTTTNFGLTECQWPAAYTLSVPTTWTTGAYIVKLKRLDSGLEQYMTFVVRNDSGPADIVLSEDVTTWQAYNFWGGAGNNNIGYSLYGKFNDVTYSNLSGSRAYAVSFDRPYLDQGATDGAGNFMVWDYPMIRWLESQGYNVSYATDVDLETNPNLLAGRKAFINTGHDEYYSANMRSHVQGFINAGVNVGFFSANNIYYQIRWANSSSGQADRIVICYKDSTLDPTTIRWRDLSPPQPENAIVGVLQNGTANDRAYRVYDATSWIYAGTGLVNYTGGTPVTSGSGQNAIAGIIGYEFDERADNDTSLSSFVSFDPAGLHQVGHSNVPAGDNGVAAFSDATLYTASSGAIVFAAGTLQWSWGVDNGFNDGFCNCNPGYANSKSQQITANILNKFISTTPPAPAVSLSPTSLSFGSQNVNTTSAAQAVTLTNSGNAALTISSIGLSGTNSGDFAQTNTCPSSSSTLAAGASCTINVTFTPTASGSRSASVSITDNAAGSPHTVALSGSGTTAPAVSLSPTSLSFGSQNVNTTSAAQAVTLTNSGNAALTISSIGLSGTNSGDFAQTNTCPSSSSTLAAGASCTISVTFTPTAIGSRSASVSITDNASGSPHTVALSGSGTTTAAPAVSLSPTSLSFGNQQVNTTSAAQAVTLTNSGNADLTISSIALTGTNAGDFAQTNTCPSTLAAGASCAINVTFTPTATGSRSASISITDNAPGSPHTVALSGSGTTPVVSLSPSSLNFSNQNVNTTSAAQAVTLTNSGTAALTISSIALTGTNAGDFAQTNTCPSSSSTLAAGASCTINVTFTPTAGGSRSASVSITDNAAGSPQSVTLSGSGVALGTYFSDGFESGDFSQWTVPAFSGQATVQSTVVNSGTHAASFTNASGQYIYLYANLASGAQTQTYTRFYFRFASLGGSTPIAYGRDVNGNTLWEVDYDAGRQGIDVYFWNGARTRYDIYSNTNVLSANTWYSIEVQDTETSTGHGEVWLNGTSIGAVNNDLSVTAGYARLFLYDQAVGTAYFDDVVASSTYNGPINPTPAVSLSPTSLSFNNQTVNTTSAAQTVTLTNSGTGSLTINSIGLAGTNAGDFAQTNTCPSSSSMLVPGASCTISVTFTPTASGSRSGSVSITDNASGSPQSVALSGTGVTPAPAVSLSPTSLSFNNQNVGTTSAAQTVTLTNSGTGSLTISSIALSGTNAGDFAQTNTCPSSSSTLAAGATCTISVTFSPTASGSRSGSVSITDNAAGSPQSVALSGSGVAAGTYFSDGFESGNFSQWTVPAFSGQATVQSTVVNSGTHAASFTNASGQYIYLYANLAGGAQTQTYTRFYFRFASLSASTPIAYGRDVNGNTLWEVDYDAGRQGIDVYFWNGARTRYDIYSNTNALSANTWYSIEVQGTETSTGHGEVWLNGTSIGAVNNDLSVTAGYARLFLYDEAAGTAYFDDVAVSNSYNGPLGGGTPAVSLSPTSLSFNNQNVGSTSAAQTVTLSNSGNAALTISSIALSGTNAGDFAQTNTCPSGSSTLAGGSSCTISVTFTPTASGSRTASVTITDNASGSPHSVSLSGSGVAAGSYFSDGFESGNFSQWTVPAFSGQATVQSTVVNSGTHAASFTNASGQYVYLYADLAGGAQTQTYTRFYFRFASLSASTPIAYGRDVNGNTLWEVDYDAGRQGIDVYFWNGARTRYDIYSNTNVLSANTWYSIEVQDTETSTGHGEVWLNGTSIGAVNNDLSVTAGYARLFLYDEAAGTAYFDDVKVSNTYNGP